MARQGRKIVREACGSGPNGRRLGDCQTGSARHPLRRDLRHGRDGTVDRGQRLRANEHPTGAV